jgi:hypothetical protein
MIIQTQYSYEKTWSDTSEKDLLRIIEEEVGDADPAGTLAYVQSVVKTGKIITVGTCKFKRKGEENVSK